MSMVETIDADHRGLRDLVGSFRSASESRVDELSETKRHAAVHTPDSVETSQPPAFVNVAPVDQLDSEVLAIDSNEQERLQQFETIASKPPAEFDADAAQYGTLETLEPIQDISASQEQSEESPRLNHVDAAADAGKIEREDMRQELQRTNDQAPELTTIEQHGSDDRSALVTELADASRKLNDAAEKLDKAIAGSQKLILLKD